MRAGTCLMAALLLIGCSDDGAPQGAGGSGGSSGGGSGGSAAGGGSGGTGGTGGSTCGDGHLDAGEDCDDGNSTPLDGCENDCTVSPFRGVECPAAGLQPPAKGTCTVEAGGAARLLTGVVLTEGVLVGGQVLVDDHGIVRCVDCDCSGAPGADAATKVVCPHGVISPGLINTHDHLRQAVAPLPASAERYEHRHDWRLGLNGHTVFDTGPVPTVAQVQWAELRQVMAGTTSIAGDGGAKGLLRNLEGPDTGSGANQEGLGLPPAKLDNFPMGDITGVERTNDCAFPALTDGDTSNPGPPASGAGWLPHLANGISRAGRQELACSAGVGDGSVSVLSAVTGVVHGAAATAVEVARVHELGASLVWSPQSNMRLFGDTARVPLWVHMKVPVAIGTDFIGPGSMNLLRELACADSLDEVYFGHALSDEDLWAAVTSRAADAAGVSSLLGRLKVGAVADIAIFAGDPARPYRSVIEAQPQDVVLTLRAGKPLYGDVALVAALTAVACDPISVCGVDRCACVQDELGTGLTALQAANASSYPLFACGDPPGEPTCAPQRPSFDGSTAYTGTVGAGDSDGDGIPDAMDACPAVFDPARPGEGGVQDDADGDGMGDSCDPCPLDAHPDCAPG